jgi:hypothetical protein
MLIMEGGGRHGKGCTIHLSHYLFGVILVLIQIINSWKGRQDAISSIQTIGT